MVSLASEQWPDTVLPSVTQINPFPTDPLVISVASGQVFAAWEQISLELSKIPCQVVCQFGPTPLQKTLMYGSRVMPLRIFENVHKCDVRGFVKNGDALDIVCADTFVDNPTGWRASAEQIVCLEIRTKKGTVTLRVDDCNNQRSAADELSCWMWSVSSKENSRKTHLVDILAGLEKSGVLTHKMLNILK